MPINLKQGEIRVVFAKLRGFIQESLDDAEMAERLGISWNDLLELKRRFYEHETEAIRNRSTEQTFVRYAIEQRQCVSDLQKVIDDYESQKNIPGYVGAVRAKSEILERTMKMGVDLGLVRRLSDSQGYSAGEAIKSMTNPELRQYIYAEINVFNQMRLQHGEQGILDVPIGPIHRSLVTEKTPVKPHERNKVHGGRRIVKEKR